MQTAHLSSLIAALPGPYRIALAYAPASTRNAWLGFLALDSRLAAALRSTREPLLAQVRLAWWRDRLAEAASEWPGGEPLLALLDSWHGAHGELTALVDGWERLLGEPPLPHDALAAFVSGRAMALAGLARLLGHADRTEIMLPMVRGWAAADLALHVSDPAEVAAARDLAGEPPQPAWLPRRLRPLVVLEGLARRQLRQGRQRGADGFVAMRLGMFGR